MVAAIDAVFTGFVEWGDVRDAVLLFAGFVQWEARGMSLDITGTLEGLWGGML